MTSVASVASVLSIEVQLNSGVAEPISVTVREGYNFGYASRDPSGVAEHLDEMRALGMAAPTTIPAIFPIPPDRISTMTSYVVSGDQTYGEVEFALIKTAERGWLVTIASDHTDLEVERVNMPKAKATCPDVIGAVAWPLDEVIDVWDRFVLTLWGQTVAGERVLLQQGAVGELMSPRELIRTLEGRRQSEVGDGTVIMSGTIAGEPTTGIRCWIAELSDPASNRRLTLRYEITELQEEL
jgi:hypothetical protein